MRDRLLRWAARRTPGAHRRYLALRAAGAPRWKAWPALGAQAGREMLLGPGPALGSGKTLPAGGSESALFPGPSPQELAAQLAPFDVVSFDVFDTLLLRAADDPRGVFQFVGALLGCPDFRRLRAAAEQRAREEKRRRQGLGEVTLREIWETLSREIPLSPQEGMAAELRAEAAFCRGNPYFLPVVESLRRQGKALALLSDMYLPADFLQGLLEREGFGRFSLCLVSGEEGASKGEGGLHAQLRRSFPSGARFAHVGDHPQADGAMARSQGAAAFLYPNVHRAGAPCRGEDLSPGVGCLWRGLVNRRLRCGAGRYSPLWEYGYACGGLFALGYCRFIRAQAQALGAQRLLFLSRDGAALLEVYRRLYPEDPRPVYAYWSRMAAAKVTAGLFSGDFFRRFLDHSPGRPLESAFSAMGLAPLLEGFCRESGSSPRTPLTHKNAPAVQHYLRRRWEQALALLAPQRQGAGLYYRELLEGCSKAIAVDIGWAGSGAAALSWAAKRLWGLPVEIFGLVAGTNSAHSPEQDAAEPLLLSGQLRSYLFSPGENRDLWKFHRPGEGHNLFFELLLGSPEGSLRGFSLTPEGGYAMEFSPNPHPGAAKEVHRGIDAFVEEFLALERGLGRQVPLSGRDAYAPMLEVLAPQNAPYRRALEAYLDEPGVG